MEIVTCETGEAKLGDTRVVRKHWRAGATKVLAEIMVDGPQQEYESKGGKVRV